MKKTIIISTIILAIALGVFLFLRNKKKSASKEEPETKTSDTFPLKLGSVGNNVFRLQKKLNEAITALNKFEVMNPIARLTEDGIFGTNTKNTVYQIFEVYEVSQELFTKNNM
ncbi:hypothetical protein FACS1894153_0330 [Bacteroidia bacterium]|nr:hypothetical protein FACS1894153_0330 [Bacteroidia bacterium]